MIRASHIVLYVFHVHMYMYMHTHIFISYTQTALPVLTHNSMGGLVYSWVSECRTYLECKYTTSLYTFIILMSSLFCNFNVTFAMWCQLTQAHPTMPWISSSILTVQVHVLSVPGMPKPQAFLYKWHHCPWPNPTLDPLRQNGYAKQEAAGMLLMIINITRLSFPCS